MQRQKHRDSKKFNLPMLLLGNSQQYKTSLSKIYIKKVLATHLDHKLEKEFCSILDPRYEASYSMIYDQSSI